MICVSLAESNPKDCIEAMESLTLAEIRIDAMNVDINDMKDIFCRSLPLIATFRPEGSGTMKGRIFDDDTRQKFLIAAIAAGAKYVDIEAGSSTSYREEIIHQARLKGCTVIISHHDFLGTPPMEELLRIVEGCFDEGGRIAKIACMVNSPRDNIRLLRLLDQDDYGQQIVVIGMGTKGRLTRVAAPLLGSPFTYASRGAGKETAEGQLDRDKVEELIGILRDE